MPLEIEAKFLITNLEDTPYVDKFPPLYIQQTYLASDDESVERRLRHSILQEGGNSYEYTEKTKTNNRAVREEVNRELTFEEYYALTKEIKPGTFLVQKARFKVPHGEYVLELDIYWGLLSGLAVAEIEVPDESHLKSLVLPEDLQGRNVTGEDKFSNSHLATLRSWPDEGLV